MYLGYCGDFVKHPAQPNKNYDWYTSKFGGSTQAVQHAILIDSFEPSSSDSTINNGQDIEKKDNFYDFKKIDPCDHCKKPLILITQVHAPQSLCPTKEPPTGLAAIAANSILSPNYKPPQGADDEELRTLLIFACNRETCWKDGKATWRGFRYQPKPAAKTIEEIEAEKQAKAAAFRKTLQAPVSNQNDKEDQPKKSVQKPMPSLFSKPSWNSFGGSKQPSGSSFGSSTNTASSSSSFSSSSMFSKPSTSTDTSTDNSDLEELLKLRDLSLNSKIHSQPKPNPSALESQTKSSGVQSDSTSSSNLHEIYDENDLLGFQEILIEFDKEPETLNENISNNYRDLSGDEDLNEGSEGTWAGEVYESSVSAKDKPFHRFQKRLKRSPEQCLRYWRGAEPLYAAADRPKFIPNCNHCGAKRAPEMQLTPPLIFFLEPLDKEKGKNNIEFGTVIFYSCSANCTNEKQNLFVEHVYLQKGI